MIYDVVVIGAGAAGLMCAIEAGKRGRHVAVIDHSEKIAEKIRISGGGRCNFTNRNCAPDKYISKNPRFCASALARYTQTDFIRMVERHGIAYHEKTLGQLFCDNSAGDIIAMLLQECADANVTIKSLTSVTNIVHEHSGGFSIKTSMGDITAQSLVIASGGLSIPKIGATPFGYDIAKQFGLDLVPPRAGLVPLTFDPATLELTKELSGIAVDPAVVRSEDGKEFNEAILMTHRGVSGPAILQISSYWQPGEDIIINLAPSISTMDWLKKQRQQQPKTSIENILSEIMPKRLAQTLTGMIAVEGRIADMHDKTLQKLSHQITQWRIKPSGSEGYRTAEVTLGGVDTKRLSSKTMESNNVKGLYFIGEVVDVTGHLGGYNFQWAWSSGWCAGQYA